uniref:Uncharacterized protein n=1 Tax=Rhizophora mucronata TaxID=61149 RepID=A0A2P2ND74_RHIMU
MHVVQLRLLKGKTKEPLSSVVWRTTSLQNEVYLHLLERKIKKNP